MAKTETEKLAGTLNGCLQAALLILILLVGGCFIGPCMLPLLGGV
jgi:hypothetical protein